MSNLATLSVLDLPGGYLDSLRQAALGRGIEIHNERLDDADDLPERLRQLARRGIDALWLPPDPLLINVNTFAVFREFSRANGVPFYAPTAGFVEAGAVAAVAPSFREIGVVAASATLDLLAGVVGNTEVYPAHGETTVNLEAARRAGLSEDDVRRVADRLIETVH